MAKYRRRLSKKSSKKRFSRSARKVHRKNVAMPFRGGHRI